MEIPAGPQQVDHLVKRLHQTITAFLEHRDLPIALCELPAMVLGEHRSGRLNRGHALC